MSREPSKHLRFGLRRAGPAGATRPWAPRLAHVAGLGTRPRLAHVAGLDGLRGIAVLAVLLYHGGVSWAPGGFLGVEVFFVLSGFLITTLLVVEWEKSSTIALGAFWARRARRLLPALFCLVAAIGVYYVFAGATQAVPGLKGDGISALTYFSNWHQIVAGANYFAATGPVSPLEHTWSLAIEEQFYLAWPLVVMAVLGLARRGRADGGATPGMHPTARADRRPLALLLALSLAGAIASALDMTLLFDGGRNLNRIYYGTDTRASGLLIGASLAIALAILRRGRGRSADLPLVMARRRMIGALALVALGLTVTGMAVVNGATPWMYPYGLLGLDAAVALLIVAAVADPACSAARVLAVRPLCALGAISYGVYLWHFPLFLWLSGLARKFAHVSIQAASCSAGGASSLSRTRLRSWRVNFHSNGWAICW